MPAGASSDAKILLTARGVRAFGAGYVMSVVSPEERSAAATVTSVPRSLAAAGSSLLGSYLFQLSLFGWPHVIGGGPKAVYDLLFYMFGKVKPPEE